MKNQSGFTLVEIAIVLVVIGLLLGGVLKGQELVLNARIRNAISEYNNIASANFAYQDRYRAVPGDDPGANGRFPAVVPAIVDGNGNGILEGDNNYGAGTEAAAADETGDFWQHLRNDRLVVGALGSTNLPVNSFDGSSGVQTTAFGGIPPNGIPGEVICHSNIGFKPAQIIDTRLDDGSSNTGTVMSAADNGALAALPGAAIAAYVIATPRYVMCREL